ncbi:MAG: hypothetical protein RSA65_10305, partial [Clostridia bacterium]
RCIISSQGLGYHIIKGFEIQADSTVVSVHGKVSNAVQKKASQNDAIFSSISYNTDTKERNDAWRDRNDEDATTNGAGESAAQLHGRLT